MSDMNETPDWTPPRIHWGRAWAGTYLEDRCQCPKAPCGLVDTETLDPECREHGPRFAKSTRQGHRHEECWAVANEEKTS